MRFGLFVALIVALASPAAWAGPAPVKLKKAASADAVSTGEALAGKLNNGRFPGAEERDPRNGMAFLHLAANHDDPKVVAAALRAMSYTWRSSSRKGSKRQVMNADYIAVVRARLADADGAVRLQALRAARLPLSGKRPDKGTLDAVLAILARPEAANQLAALTALGNVRDFATPRAAKGPIKGQVIDAIMPLLLSKEAHVLAGALDRLAKSAFPAMPKAKALAGHSLRLAKHPEAAVRGESMRLATALAGKKVGDGLLGRLTMSLGDSDPYVRAVAIEQIAEVRYVPAVHLIMPLIDDAAPAVRKLSGYTTLDGRADSDRYRAESARRVDDVALRAVDKLTNGIGPKLNCTPKGRNKKKARAEAVTKAKAWYGAHKGKLPKAPTVPGAKGK